jgi:hypothetical protein
MSELAKVFSPKVPAAPAMPAPVTMPDTQDKSAQEARQRQIELERKKGGRDSTNLTGTTQPYSNASLGL